jgi:hypothetical protein
MIDNGRISLFMRSCVRILLVLAVCQPVFSRDTVGVIESGRRIQLDGFLLDWVKKGQHVWRGSGGWVWDAINTPEGVAGYFHCGVVSCSSWNFFIDPRRLTARPWKMHLDSSSQSGNHHYRAQRTDRDSLFSVTFEWLVPWDSLALDSSGNYAIHCIGENGCGDSIPPFIIVGTRNAASSFLPPRFKTRVALIVALLALFIALQLTMKKKRRRREPLRRSA